MRRLGFQAILAGCLIVLSHHAGAADASREKCTCDAKPQAIQDNGAWVSNATACWASVDQEREWCQLTVEAIEGDGNQVKILNHLVSLKELPEEAADYLKELSQRHLLTNAEEASPTLMDAKSSLPQTIDQFRGVIAECLKRYVEYGKKMPPLDEGGAACRTGESTGWLRVEFRVGKVIFAFMIAPND